MKSALKNKIQENRKISKKSQMILNKFDFNLKSNLNQPNTKMMFLEFYGAP